MPEQMTKSWFDFLHNKPALVVTGLLVVEIALFNVVPTKEFIPSPPPLADFAAKVGGWQTVEQIPLDAYTQSFLKADDTLTRRYAPGDIELFAAFFKSQRAGVTPHSPKVCLPGNGWTEESSRIIEIAVPGETAPIPVNRYLVSHNEDRSLVLYWYQNPHRVTANEYLSKFYLIWDALRYHRSDELLVRVITHIGGKSDPASEAKAIEFIQAVYQPLKQHIWTLTSTAAVLPGDRP